MFQVIPKSLYNFVPLTNVWGHLQIFYSCCKLQYILYLLGYLQEVIASPMGQMNFLPMDPSLATILYRVRLSGPKQYST